MKTIRLTSEERANIAARLLEDPNVSKVAREFGRAKGTVSKIARDVAADVERSRTRRATEARASDNAERLEELKTKFLNEAEKALDELHAPSTLHNWHSGKHNEHTLNEPTFKDKRDIMWRAGGAIRSYLEIDSHQGGGEESYSAVDDWLAAISGAE